MIRTTLFRLTLATILGGGAFCSRSTAPRWTVIAGIIRRARIGRPLTPMSYAGVARRTTRRAVAVGAAGAVAAGAYYAAPGTAACSQVVDAYGRIVTVCQ
jgi:hypothetical protein